MFYDKFFEFLDLNEIASPFNMVSLGFKEFCLEGKYGITLFLDNKIVLSIKKQKVFIYGKNLQIKDMDNFHITISGEIDTISKKELSLKQSE